MTEATTLKVCDDPELLVGVNEKVCPLPAIGVADVPEGEVTVHEYVAPVGQELKFNCVSLHC